MKSFSRYITKQIARFGGLILTIIIINGILFVATFYGSVKNDYGKDSPQKVLDVIGKAYTKTGIPCEIEVQLQSNNIWAMLLNDVGAVIWQSNVPLDIPSNYTVGQVAVFSKGYLNDYPVFVRNMQQGLFVVGYPKNSYAKLVNNYFSITVMQRVIYYIIGMIIIDLFLLFLVYFLSKRRIMRKTEPIIDAIASLADGKMINLDIQGELGEVAVSVNQASKLLGRQNEARANWISGVSHDIRTPLSMIMGYAQRIITTDEVNEQVKEEAKIISKQSSKIKELVQDLNLVSRLEYEMQPLHKEPVRMAKLLRTYVADLMNHDLPSQYQVELNIDDSLQHATVVCDKRLITRVINNLVQNSMNHNPLGCDISIGLSCEQTRSQECTKQEEKSLITLIIKDNGIGITPEKQQELANPHYMESLDERLDLRHGLGLVLVKQIVTAHNGTVQITSESGKGYETKICFELEE